MVRASRSVEEGRSASGLAAADALARRHEPGRAERARRSAARAPPARAAARRAARSRGEPRRQAETDDPAMSDHRGSSLMSELGRAMVRPTDATEGRPGREAEVARGLRKRGSGGEGERRGGGESGGRDAGPGERAGPRCGGRGRAVGGGRWLGRFWFAVESAGSTWRDRDESGANVCSSARVRPFQTCVGTSLSLPPAHPVLARPPPFLFHLLPPPSALRSARCVTA